MQLSRSVGLAPSFSYAGDQEAAFRASWQHLAWFFSFRFILAILLLLGFALDTGPAMLGSAFPRLFLFTSISYLLLVIGSGLLLYWRAPGAEQQAYLMVFTDIFAITLIMHSSGGVESGLGMLLLVSIAGGSLLMEGQAALLFAALASLAILSAQVYAQLAQSFSTTAYTQAGILGASFLAVALLAHVLSLRIRASEKLATQRGLDLANMAELNDYIIQHMRTGILAVDDHNRIRLVNGSTKELLGSPLIKMGQSLEVVCPQLSRQLVKWVCQDRNAKSEVFRAIPGGKNVKPGFAQLGSGGAVGTLIFLEDNAVVTQQAQQIKLASLGRLTASIAHEIRNPLGAILHAAQLLEESSALAAEDRRFSEIIRGNSERVNEIIENILQLSRRQPSRTTLIELPDWLESFVEEFTQEHDLDADTLSMQTGGDSETIRSDNGQIRQILTILCENSLAHAGRDLERLKISIRTGKSMKTGAVFVDVIDNGLGIDPEVARQMFEPFFTTHSTGTGLGLYIARELSESNQIRLECIENYRPGTCFRLSFPDVRKRELMP